MNVIDLETPLNTEKHIAPKENGEYPFYIPEYGRTFSGTPCYQLRMEAAVGCVQYVVAGTGIIICNDKMYTVEQGDTFLLCEGSNHIYYSNPDNRFERIWINFKGALARSLINIYKLNETVVFKNTDTERLLKKIHSVCRAQSNAADYHAATAPLFLQLVLKLSENKKNTAKNTGDPSEKIRSYIDCRITENVKMCDLARAFGFSEEHIIRIFKKNYGITPHKYILLSKIRLAMLMLKTADYSIEQIAYKLNFSDSRHFSTQFKQIMGYSPSEYRKKA